ncbi:uncharacterized protein BDZ99DRAFT_479661 [Mytilinidion resinicola]|uniref:Myb-like domain-containing protein n=1 Tax=Mytilinidion resinicola TaxID=574789 RepID=A0A6A6YE99_9PEZI|nr:uncharacterized protein BDZ99DRAFT_479661 [Mytilinidion resinicola]KAF2806405.1 hypothetical protein BDZ99DRAFT_479661 [Mytilinidion resinicola]
MTSFRQCELSNRRSRKKGCSTSRATLRPQDWSAMRTKTSRQVLSSQSQHLSWPRTDRATRSSSPQTSSPRTKAVSEPNDGLSTNTAYQITDVACYPIPKASSIVTATVSCKKSKLPLDPIALATSILGERGQVIRITQSRTVLSADQSNPHSDAANYDADHADNYMSEEDEDDDGDEDKDKTEYRPYAMSPDPRFNRGEMRFRPRTRVSWLQSDDLRLLTYRNNMAMEWKKIFELFPDRTPGAIRTRYHMLQGKSSIAMCCFSLEKYLGQYPQIEQPDLRIRYLEMLYQGCIANIQREALTNSHNGSLQFSDAFPIVPAPVYKSHDNPVVAADTLTRLYEDFFYEDLKDSQHCRILQTAFKDEGASQPLPPQKRERTLQMIMQCTGDGLISGLDRALGQVRKDPLSSPTFNEAIAECLRKINIHDEELHIATLKGRILLVDLARTYQCEFIRIQKEMKKTRNIRRRMANNGENLLPLPQKGMRTDTRVLEQISKDLEQTFDENQR